jgi:hypothetical protein
MPTGNDPERETDPVEYASPVDFEQTLERLANGQTQLGAPE